MSKIIKWVIDLTKLEKCFVAIGGLLFIYALSGTIITSEWSISTDLSVWKDRAEFWAILFGPYITGTGACYVWKTLKYQSNTRLEDKINIETVSGS